MKVAVIGAGPAGLVTARECLRQGCEVVVFEAGSEVGGVWVYTDETDVHSSLYASLTTNLPRDLMAFSDYTFDSKGGGDDHWPRFPHHTCVRQYLDNFADDFDIRNQVLFKTPVNDVEPTADSWQVEALGRTYEFDAVAVCNGHYAKPRVPELAGLDNFRGQVIHAHNYRHPRDVTGKRVAIWGTAASGLDLTFEIDADEIHWFGNMFTKTVALDEKRTAYPSLTEADVRGRLVVGDQRIEVDTLLLCTGYHYDFPFLSSVPVQVDDNWVHPLYQDMVPPSMPGLGFIGLPFLVTPFPILEIQAKWYSRQLTGRFALPDETTMAAAVKERETELLGNGVLRRHFHRLGDQQVDYFNLLANQCNEPELPAWFIETWQEVSQLRQKYLLEYKQMPLAVRGPTVCL